MPHALYQISEFCEFPELGVLTFNQSSFPPSGKRYIIHLGGAKNGPTGLRHKNDYGKRTSNHDGAGLGKYFVVGPSEQKIEYITTTLNKITSANDTPDDLAQRELFVADFCGPFIRTIPIIQG